MANEPKERPEPDQAALPTAKAVREEIERLTGHSPEGGDAAKEAPRSKSLREAIQERMQELDKKKNV
jgi:hypothetical protein